MGFGLAVFFAQLVSRQSGCWDFLGVRLEPFGHGEAGTVSGWLQAPVCRALPILVGHHSKFISSVAELQLGEASTVATSSPGGSIHQDFILLWSKSPKVASQAKVLCRCSSLPARQEENQSWGDSERNEWRFYTDFFHLLLLVHTLLDNHVFPYLPSLIKLISKICRFKH